MAALFRIGWLLAVVCAAALASPSPARAQSRIAGTTIPVCVKRIAAGETAARVLASPRGFDCTTPQTRFGPGDYWVISAPIAARAPGETIALRTASVWQYRQTLHALRADGTIDTWTSDDRTLSRRLQLGAIVEHQPSAGPAVVRLLWRIDGSANLRGILLGARLATPRESAAANLKMAALYAGFAGLCIALLVHNLAMWRVLRHRFQLAYVAMLVALLVYAASASGAVAMVLPDLANTDRLRINYVALAACAVAALAFARHFFEARVFAGWLGRAADAIGIGLAGSALLLAMVPPRWLALVDGLYSAAFVALIGVVVPVLWRAWRLRSEYLWLFAVGWAAPIAFAAVRVLHNVAPLPWSFWLDNSTLLAMTAEALLSSVAITHRVRLIARERDEARSQELATRVLADTDPLTGLLNRRAFLSSAIGRTEMQTLLLLDIDHFKRVNDTIGHDGGDEVLRLFARVLRHATPPGGLAARLGGEEFAILAPAANAPDCEQLLDRLRGARMPFDLSVTASIGSCAGPIANEAAWKALYRSADRALFEAKSAGRDRARAGDAPDRQPLAA